MWEEMTMARFHFACYLALAAGLAMLIPMVAAAQEFRGSITGRVTDANGAVVPGATVSLKNSETNVPATTTTNGEGSYDFPLLISGKYCFGLHYSPGQRSRHRKTSKFQHRLAQRAHNPDRHAQPAVLEC